MTLLFDENLSAHLAEILIRQYPGAVHVRDIGLKSAPDPIVWAYAANHG